VTRTAVADLFVSTQFPAVATSLNPSLDSLSKIAFVIALGVHPRPPRGFSASLPGGIRVVNTPFWYATTRLSKMTK